MASCRATLLCTDVSELAANDIMPEGECPEIASRAFRCCSPALCTMAMVFASRFQKAQRPLRLHTMVRLPASPGLDWSEGCWKPWPMGDIAHDFSPVTDLQGLSNLGQAVFLLLRTMPPPLWMPLYIRPPLVLASPVRFGSPCSTHHC